MEANTQQQTTKLTELRGEPKPQSQVAVAKATVRDLFAKALPAIEQALPKHMTGDYMMRVALTAINTTPKLLECHPATLVGATIQAAQLGLEPNTPQGLAYFVPFKNTKKNRMEVQLIPGYRGLIKLARQSGEITTIEARVVYAHDKFDLTFGIDQRLVHVPMIDGEPGERRLAYAIARLKDAEHSEPIIEIMTKTQILGIKARSKSKDREGNNFGPWATDEDQMWRKTVIRRICNYLPASRELALALALDDRAGHTEQHLDTVIDGSGLVLPDDDFTPADDTPEGKQEQGEQRTDPPAGDAPKEDKPKRERKPATGSMD
jgi:recombination protein RecT